MNEKLQVYGTLRILLQRKDRAVDQLIKFQRRVEFSRHNFIPLLHISSLSKVLER